MKTENHLQATETQLTISLTKVKGAGQREEPAQPAGKRILLVDDNAEMRECLRRLLDGYDVEAAVDGVSALRAARERKPDLVLTDLMMPGMDGFELLRELRADPRTREIPIIMLSARDGEESRIEGFEAGADDYLIKPFSAREVLARVRSHLKLAELRRQAQETIRHSEEHLRAIVDTTPACIKVVAADGTLLDMNTAGLAMIEADSGEQVIGASVYDLIAEEYREDFKAFNERICRGEKGSLEFEIIGLNGTRRRMETYAAPLHTPDGSFSQLAITQDITRRKRDEEALKTSEERFRSLCASSPVGIFTTDIFGRCTYTNPRCQAICGFTAAEALGEGWASFIHPDDRQPVFNEWSKVALAGKEYFSEFRWKHADDVVRWSRIRSSPMHSDDGSLLGHVGTVEDITDERRSEAMLMGQKRVLELLIEGAPLGEVLDALCEIIESQSDEKLIATVLLLDEDAKRLHSVAGRRVPATYSAAIDGTEIGPSVGSCGTAAYRQEPVMAADIATDPLWVDFRELALSHGLRACWSMPIFSSQEKVLGTFAVYYDRPRKPNPSDVRLTEMLIRTASIAIERRRDEEAISTQNDRLRLLWEAAGVLLTTDEPDAMLQSLFAKISESLGLDVYFNFMVTEAEDSLALVSCAGVPKEVAQSISRLEFGQAVCGNVALYRRPLVKTRIHESSEPMVQLVKSFGIRAYACNPLIAGGRLLGTLSFASRTREQFEHEEIEFLETISQYVTVAYERLRLIEQLRDQDQRKDEFLATLAHELRNPLAPIRNALQILHTQGPAVPKLQWARDVIDRQVDQMARLVDDLLDVSRITRGNIELRKQLVELRPAVNEAVEVCRPLIEQWGHTLSVELPPERIVLEADPIRLAQILFNLLNNAAKYTERGGQIWLTATRRDGIVEVRVKDNGVGIPPEMLSRVFELFRQVDTSIERSQGGLGIGLTLVKRLVSMHGGEVEAHSQGQGTGSEFVVRLPVSAVAEASEVEPPKSLAEKLGPAQKRILVVDDNRDSADSMAMFLKLKGHKVCTANDGLAALNEAQTFEPELILLDIGLPKLNGYEVAQRLRELYGAKLVLIAVTGWGQEEDKRRSQQAGFDAHLVKPVDFEVFEKLLVDLSGK